MSDPSVHHHIGQSEKNHDDIGSYLRARDGDPAMKVRDYRPSIYSFI
jgi:hypothetical protein